MGNSAEALSPEGATALWTVLIHAHTKSVEDRLARERVVDYIRKPRPHGEPRPEDKRTWNMNMQIPRSMVSIVFAAQWAEAKDKADD